MIVKTLKYGVILVLLLVVGSWLVLGGDAYGYVKTAWHSWRQDIKESVPVEMELARARDLLEDILPEMQANIRLIAREEVELADLAEDIDRSAEALAVEREKVARLSELLDSEDVYFTLGRTRYTRQDIKANLAARFERYKESEMVLADKRRLMANRHKALRAAVDMLHKARSQKALLEQRIAALDSQNRLLAAASVGSQFAVDSSKLAQTDKLLRKIKKRLDVAERVLAHEGRFVDDVEIDVVDEGELLSDVDEYFSESLEKSEQTTPLAARTTVPALPVPAGKGR